jgi:hypothetical protein
MVGDVRFLRDPLQGKTSLNQVFWLYGVVGSLIYGALELFLDPANAVVMGLYVIGGLALSVYVAVATFRCAKNCRSKFWALMAQGSAVLSLILLPYLTYLELTGGLDKLLLGVLGTTDGGLN